MKVFITGILLSATVLAAPARTSLLEDALRQAAGKQVEFTQRFTPQGFTTQQVERGVVVFGDAPKMRWNYAAPEQKTFVFDGVTSWLYSPADRQVTISKVTEEDRRTIPFLLLSDPAALNRHFTVTEKTSARSTTATVKPKTTSSPIREVILTVDRSSRQIRTLSYVDRQGNKTMFEFRNYRKAAPGELTFRFTPPPGVDVIEARR